MMPVKVKKTPPFLKALAEARARAAGKVKRSRRAVDHAAGLLETARVSLARIDDEIRSVESRLDPNDIEPNSGRELYRWGEESSKQP